MIILSTVHSEERKQRYCHCCIQFNGSPLIFFFSSLLNSKFNDDVCAVMEVSLVYFVSLYNLCQHTKELLIPESTGSSTLCKDTYPESLLCRRVLYFSINDTY